MCWNAEVSLNTFVFSIFVLLLIIYNNTFTQYKIQELNNIWVYLFLTSFIFMQFIEFFIWRNINNKFYNQFFSIMAVCLLIIQPISSMMLLSNISLRNTLLITYLSLVIPYSIYNFFTVNIYSRVSKNGHLRWKFFELPQIIWVIWLFFFLFSFFYEKQWFGFGFGIITLCITTFNYSSENVVGSVWCWVVNSVMIYYAFYLLLVLPFLEKNSIC